ncbi:MAG: hypothetical protein ACI9D0_001347 [Bacteroidia bacterium]|jgi:uncharacterized protein (DUF2164 family)
MPKDPGPLRIRLSDDRRGALKRDLSAYFEAQFGEPLSDFRADELVAFFMQQLGPQVYNQAIADARGFMLEKIDDLEVEVYEPDGKKR